MDDDVSSIRYHCGIKLYDRLDNPNRVWYVIDWLGVSIIWICRLLKAMRTLCERRGTVTLAAKCL